MRHLRVVLALAGLVLLAGLFSFATPTVSAAGAKDGSGGGGFLAPPEANQSLVATEAKPNCFWWCSDGRTGQAEVINYPDDCKALCEKACGGKCTEVK